MKSHPTNAIEANILIVDDTLANLSLLFKALTDQGYKVRAVTNGKMALKAVQTMPPDLILLDVKMPEMDGYEVCQQLKASSATHNIPVIFLSALSESVDKIKGFEVGGIDYVTKPFQIPELLLRIKNQLQLQAAREEIRRLNQELEKRVEERTTQLEKEITEHIETQQQLRHMAFHDSLTNLPNRAFFLEILQKTIYRGQRRQNYFCSVLFLDCDRFKVVNDSLGHLVGDRVLIEVACRLESCLRPMDTVARFGGDEFTILLDEIGDFRNIISIAERINQVLKLPFYIDNQEIFLSCSIGIVLVDQDYSDPDMILRDADIAMYRAKALGRDRYQIFAPEMHTNAQEVLQLETDLRLGLKKNEFELHYQPIVSLINNSITGFEALLRWNHSKKGFISPTDFIPIAEETGLIVPIGMWVLREACFQLRTWQEQNPHHQDLTISVNLSVKQFSQPNLIEQIDEILTETGLESKCLKLEITESAIMDNAESIADLLQQLRNRQIQLSIDDFGTGYSSLSYLHRFPVDTLKIDRSFINRIGDDGKNIEIIQAIATLAHHLGMNIVAEGVETKQQLDQLRAIRCEQAQGYLFSKPLKGKLLDEMLTKIVLDIPHCSSSGNSREDSTTCSSFSGSDIGAKIWFPALINH